MANFCFSTIREFWTSTLPCATPFHLTPFDCSHYQRMTDIHTTEVVVPVRALEGGGEGIFLRGTLALPNGCNGLVVFAHGSGSSRFRYRRLFKFANCYPD